MATNRAGLDHETSQAGLKICLAIPAPRSYSVGIAEDINEFHSPPGPSIHGAVIEVLYFTYLYTS
jgi:hypothetical protein